MAIELTKGQKIGISLFVVVVVVIFVLIMSWVFSDDESVSECIRPSNTTGYNNITETNLSMGSEFDVSVSCASGYTGTASATACSVAGQAYTLSGCSADSTNSPCSLSTLTQPTNGSWGTTCSSNSGEIQHGASCDLSCNTGYTPSDQPTCNNGELSSTTLTCTSGDCTTPDPVPTGYDISSVTGSLSKDSFSITGVECATGYDGIASATACGTVGGEYTLSGCSVADSAGSGGSINNCNANEPNLANSNMDTIIADSCDGIVVGETCNHTCNNGYTGGSVTCQADGTWEVEPCTLASEPAPASATTCSDNPCGPNATCTDNAGGYTCSCNDGFIGTTTTNEPAVCTPVCIRPSNTTGYNNITENNLSMGPGFDVSADCAVGYTGTANATVCNAGGEAYTLDGCSDIDGCAGIDCGLYATCRDNAAPQTGYTCDPYTWVLSDNGQTCTDACAATTSTPTCTDGNWAVNSMDTFNIYMAEAGHPPTLCASYFTSASVGSGTTDYESGRPVVKNNGYCYIGIGDTQSCSASVTQDYKRLCRCS